MTHEQAKHMHNSCRSMLVCMLFAVSPAHAQLVSGGTTQSSGGGNNSGQSSMPPGTLPQYKQANLPSNPSFTQAFCTDCNAAIQGQGLPTAGIPVTWNGSAWTDANGMPTWTGDYNPGIGINSSVVTTKLTVNYDFEMGGFENVYGVINMQNTAAITGNTGNTLSAINNASSSIANSGMIWCNDCRAPGQAAGKGTGRWIYKDNTGTFLDSATGAAPTN